MCYTIPGKVIEIDGRYATTEYFGEKQRVVIDLIKVQPGDYLFAQGGIAISKVDPTEALSILDDWKDIFNSMKDIDREISSMTSVKASPKTQSLIAKAAKGELTVDGACELLSNNNPDDLKALLESGNQMRWQHYGNASCVHGVIEFSNHCTRHCSYCGIRFGTQKNLYRMSIEEIITTAREAVDNYGFKAILIQSGEDNWYDDETLEAVVKKLRDLGILVFLSLGERAFETYQKLYNAGARAVLLRFETSNETLFKNFRPGTVLDKRLELIKKIKDTGFILATGFIIGLPGETDRDIVNNILLTKELKPDMYSFGPFIPAGNTPLEFHQPVNFTQVLKTIALTRLLAHDSNILVTTSMETLHKEADKEALLCGANSLMINLTPEKFKKLYSIYDDRAWVSSSIKDQVTRITSLLSSLGRSPMDVSFK